MDRGKTKGVVIAFALALASCGKSEVKLADANPIALISSGDAKACAHPDVLKVLEGLIGTPKGDEAGLILPVGAVEISKMTLPPFTVDMITLASVDMSVKRLNAAYKAAMAVRDESQKVALRNAQRTWIKHRDAKCQENLEGGTMDLLLVDSCHLSMTMKRAAELEGMTTGQ